MIVPSLLGADILRVNAVSVDVYKVKYYRDSYTDEDEGKFTKAGSFNLNLGITDWIFIDNRLHLMGTDAQVRHAGWEYRAGFDFGAIEVFWHHHSQHVMERERGPHEFPVYDFIGARIHFLRR
jgi:hypothetical protein